ncbi:MAG: DUF4390 domain-containing protein [Thermodesulfobacteriota bacterium]
MAHSSLHKRFLLLLLLWLCLKAGPAFAAGEGPRIVEPVLTNADGQLLLYFTLEGGFPAPMEQAILAGLETSFEFDVILNRVRELWPDATVAELTLVHTLTYDPDKKLFSVTRAEEPGASTVTHSFQEAKKAMSDVDRLAVCPLSELSKGELYQVKFKAVMKKVDPPLYLRYALPFLALWDFETDWYTIDFTY